QSVDIAIYEDGKFIKEDEMAFAHIPKELKRLVKPL
ncbi:MAG: malate dehydrogenase, partial [Campylobacteraceae bacterium]|nr:malate dehydrogenase [Campylobacteraceae bacterium]